VRADSCTATTGLCVRTVTNVRDTNVVAQTLRSAIGAKQHGYEDVLAPLVAEACVRALPDNALSFNVDNVRVVKIPGGSVGDATLVQGMVLTRGAEGTVRQCVNAHVAVYAGAVDVPKTETKGTVLISNADELLAFSSGEEKQMEKLVDEIAAAGVNVVVAGGGVGELAMHYLERKRIMVVKAPSKFELRRLCSAVRATPLVRMGAPTADEMGRCRAVAQGEIGGTGVTYFRNDDGSSRIATLVVRGATANLLENVERAIGV
jgi:T-complex protein 1 subunit theta